MTSLFCLNLLLKFDIKTKEKLIKFFCFRLQKFKVQTVNTIISGNNSKMETMGTEQLLDLFSHKPGTSNANTAAYRNNTGGVKTILDTLPDLWDQKQYDDEYDLSQFISKLN